MNYHWRHTLLTLPQWQFICFIKGKERFTYNDKFELYTEHWVRIKIVKPQGVSQADVAILIMCLLSRDKEKTASPIWTDVPNLENGKRWKPVLKRELVSDERLNTYHRVLKFSLPAVKVGTLSNIIIKWLPDYSSQFVL